MQLATLGDYISAARALLQDTVQPYRYDDESLTTALNMAFGEASRIRPDLLLDLKYQARSPARQALSAPSAPVFVSTTQTASVPLPTAYRMPFLYFLVGQAQLRDVTDTQDTRASAFLNKFIAELTALQA